MAQKTFFAPKGKNYYPKYPTRGGDFSTMYQKSSAKNRPGKKNKARHEIGGLKLGIFGADGPEKRPQIYSP